MKRFVGGILMLITGVVFLAWSMFTEFSIQIIWGSPFIVFVWILFMGCSLWLIVKGMRTFDDVEDKQC